MTRTMQFAINGTISFPSLHAAVALMVPFTTCTMWNFQSAVKSGLPPITAAE
jgi:hypothetical protein